MADPILLTTKPGTIALAKITIRPFKIKINKPRVIMVIGKVNRTNTGLIIVLAIPKTTLTIMAEKKSLITIPGRILEVIKTANPFTNKFNNNLISLT